METKKFVCPIDLYMPSKKSRSKNENLAMNIETYNHYVNTEISMLMSMFNYKGLHKTIDVNFMEMCLIAYGVVAIVKISDDEYYVGVPTLLPPLNNYGWGTKVEMITRNGTIIKDKTVGVDCAIVWNNNTRTPDFDLYRFANMFTECEIAIKSIIKNSKKAPIPIAKNAKVKTAIDEAIENSTNGVTSYTILNDTCLVDEINGKTSDIPVLNLTDVKDIDRLQYLSKYHDDLIRRLATLYGHDIQSSGKMAQQTTEEIKGYDSLSMIMPEIRLNERICGIDMYNDVFGESASVDYSLAWRYNIYKQSESDDGVNPNNIGG